MEPVHVAWSSSDADLDAIMRPALDKVRRNLRWHRVASVVLLLLGTVLVVVHAYFFGGVALFFGLVDTLFVLTFGRRVRERVRRVLDLPRASQRATIADTGIVFVGEHATTSYEWSAFSSMSETRGFLRLQRSERKTSLWLPIRAFDPPADAERCRTILAGHVASRDGEDGDVEDGTVRGR